MIYFICNITIGFFFHTYFYHKYKHSFDFTQNLVLHSYTRRYRFIFIKKKKENAQSRSSCVLFTKVFYIHLYLSTLWGVSFLSFFFSIALDKSLYSLLIVWFICHLWIFLQVFYEKFSRNIKLWFFTTTSLLIFIDKFSQKYSYANTLLWFSCSSFVFYHLDFMSYALLTIWNTTIFN